MSDPYSLSFYQSLVIRQCNTCGAVVNNERMHSAWHLSLAADHPDPEEEVPRGVDR